MSFNERAGQRDPAIPILASQVVADQTRRPSYIGAALKRLVQAAFRSGGLEVSRWDRSPMRTLLGLGRLSVRSIVDAGANEGQFARWISTFFPHAHIYAFEPLPGPYAILKAWAKTREGKVTTFNVALGDSSKDIVMELHVDHTPSSSILKATRLNDTIYPQTQRRSTVAVRQETLDEAIARTCARLEPEILVKLDVQGYEDRVIRGGRGTLSQACACIVEISLDELYSGQAEFPDLLSLLGEFGFSYAGNLEQNYADDGHVVYLDAVFVRGSKYNRQR